MLLVSEIVLYVQVVSLIRLRKLGLRRSILWHVTDIELSFSNALHIQIVLHVGEFFDSHLRSSTIACIRQCAVCCALRHGGWPNVKDFHFTSIHLLYCSCFSFLVA